MPVLVALGAGSLQVGGQAQGGGGRAPAQAGAGGPASQLPPQKGSGLVLGQVVDAASGAPIAEATVSVASRVPIASLVSPSQPGAPLRLMTGADGRFVLHDLPKTNLQINVTASGYINASSGQSRPGGAPRPVEVDEGQRLGDVRIRMWRPGVLTGTVVDEAGESAVGVQVRALRRSFASGKSAYAPSGSATTDDRGVYRISALTPGEYAIAVPQTITTMPAAMLDSMMQGVASGLPQGSAIADLAMSGGPSPNGMGVRVGNLLVSSASGLIPPPSADGRVSAYQALFYPAATSSTQAAVVTVGSGEERSGLDLQLKIVQTVKVSGTLTGPSGPVGSTSVRLLSAEVDELGGGAGAETATTVTAADGTFTFLGVPAGQYVARVAKPPRPAMPAGMADNPAMAFAFGMASGAAGGAAGAGAEPTLYAQASVGVSASDVPGVSLMLAEGAKVSGRIAFDGNSPPTPQQLQAMFVTLTPVAGNNGAAPAPGRVAQDAQFKTQGYPAGRYYVAPGGWGGGAWTLRSVVSGGRDVLNEPFELRDADVTDVVVTFTDKPSQITGAVHAPGGGTTPASTVIMFPADYRTWIARGMSSRLTRTSVVPKAGTFTLGTVPPGEYLLAALEDADVPGNQDAAFFEALARVATRVAVREGEKPSQTLEIVKVKK
jgi:hypothetical protein